MSESSRGMDYDALRREEETRWPEPQQWVTDHPYELHVAYGTLRECAYRYPSDDPRFLGRQCGKDPTVHVKKVPA